MKRTLFLALIGTGLMPGQALARFVDVTVDSGIQFQHHRNPLLPPTNSSVLMGAGAAWLDYNNDGWQDLYATQGDGCNKLFRNDGNGHFTDVAMDMGVGDCDEHSNGVVAADFDNDGFTDIFVTNFGQSRLYKNIGGLMFRDVTASAGLLNSSGDMASMSAAWGDFDNDGYLDLYVGNYVIGRTPGGSSIQCQPNQLWHNQRNGTFVDLGPLLGVALNGIDPRPGCTLAVAWSDYDNDGDLDLFVVNDTGMDMSMPANVLFRNDGAIGAIWQFADVSSATNARFSIAGMGIGIGDINNDGFLDYYMSSMGENVLALNNAGVTFSNIAASAGVEVTNMSSFGPMGPVSWGVGMFDFDNDGHIDIFVANGGDPPGVSMFPDTLKGEPNYMYANLDGTHFREVSRDESLLDAQVTRAAAFADFDNDGDVDIYLGNIDGTNVLYRNDGESGNNWLKVKTRGTVSNRNAIGSRITAVAGHSPQIREVNGGSSFLSMNSLDEILGFTHLTRVDQLNVRFPSGLEYEMVNLPVNQDVMVVEPVVSLSSSLKKISVPRGSSFTVPVTIKNQTGTSQNIQVWWTAITPAGDEGVVKAPTAIATLSAHQSMTSNISLSIPATAPTGNYLFLVKTGTYPSALVHQYIFQVQVGP